MTKTLHMVSESVTALLLAAALSLGGILLSGQVLESALYRQSKVISGIFSGAGDDLGVMGVVTDSRSREALLKFAGALADAYVRFELIPVNEAQSFEAVYKSMGPVIHIEEFSYRRRDLIIAGTSPDEAGYREFLRRLRARSHFKSIAGHFYTTTDDEIRFEIECAPPETK